MFTPKQRKLLLVLLPGTFLLLCIYAAWQSQADFAATGKMLGASAFLIFIALPVFYIVTVICVPLGIFLLGRADQRRSRDMRHYGMILFMTGLIYAVMAVLLRG